MKRRSELRRAEAKRIRAVQAVGRAGAECGPDILSVAPGRGAVVAFRSQVMVPDAKSEEGWKAMDDSFGGRSALRIGDAFDRMLDQSGRARGGGLFTAVQIGVGRDYAALTERVAGAGVKCSSAFSLQAGGGAGDRDFMDAYAADCELMRRFHRAIGGGAAMVVRRVRPSVRGTRRTITDRQLVDGVCLAGRTLSEVLRSFGWAEKGETREAIRRALCEALDRMLACPHKIS